MSAHTPGEWRFYSVTIAGEIHGFTVSKAGNPPRMVASVHPVDENAKEGGANARLIAAAPDLLAALLTLRKDHSRVEPHHEGMCAICKQADAAIAKATGK